MASFTPITRSANNLIEFGVWKGIAEDLEAFTITCAGGAIAGETAPGEMMEALLETVATKTTILAVGAADTGATDGVSGEVRVLVHGSAWTAADLQVAVRALGATVGANDYDLTGATVADYVF
mgnify:CR=1 FL=1